MIQRLSRQFASMYFDTFLNTFFYIKKSHANILKKNAGRKNPEATKPRNLTSLAFKMAWGINFGSSDKQNKFNV